MARSLTEYELAVHIVGYFVLIVGFIIALSDGIYIELNAVDLNKSRASQIVALIHFVLSIFVLILLTTLVQLNKKWQKPTTIHPTSTPSTITSASASVVGPDMGRRKSQIQKKLLRVTPPGQDLVVTCEKKFSPYLKIGGAIFGLGSIILNIVYLVDEMAILDKDCREDIFTWVLFLQIIWILLQAIYIHKNEMVIYNCSPYLVKFLLLEVSLSNVYYWIMGSMSEIIENVQDEYQKNFNTSLKYYKNHEVGPKVEKELVCDGYAEHVKPYLFPCTVEFALIGAALFFTLSRRVGKSHRFSQPGHGSSLSRASSENDEKLSALRHFCSQLLASPAYLAGLVGGVLLVLLVLGTAGAFFALLQKGNSRQEDDAAYILYFTVTLFLLLVTGIACILTYTTIRFFAKTPSIDDEVHFDYRLLQFSYCAVLCYDTFEISSIFFYLYRNNLSLRNYPSLYVVFVKCTLDLIQSSMQLFVILDCGGRRVSSLKEAREKAGRGMLLFLIFSNLCMWFMNTFELKYAADAPRSELHGSYNQISSLFHSVITHMLIPVVIFFRFHSTVCLADQFVEMYELEDLGKDGQSPISELTSPRSFQERQMQEFNAQSKSRPPLPPRNVSVRMRPQSTSGNSTSVRSVVSRNSSSLKVETETYI